MTCFILQAVSAGVTSFCVTVTVDCITARVVSSIIPGITMLYEGKWDRVLFGNRDMRLVPYKSQHYNSWNYGGNYH